MARITPVMESSRQRSRYVDNYSKMSGNDWWTKNVFSLWHKSAKNEDD